MFTETGHFIGRELCLIESTFAEGLFALSKAQRNYPNHFYTASFNLSISIERICKLIFIIECLTSNRPPPSRSELQSRGHNLINLVDASNTSPALESIEYKLLKVLSDFGTQTRYENLNALTTSQNSNHFLQGWSTIFRSSLIEDRKLQIKFTKHKEKCDSLIEIIEPHTFHIGMDITGKTTTLSQSMSLTFDTTIAKFLVWKTIRLFFPLKEKLVACAPHGQQSNHNECLNIPFLSEYMKDMKYYFDSRTATTQKKAWGSMIRRGIQGYIG